MSESSTSTRIAGHRIEPGTGGLLLTLALGVFAGALDLSVLSPALPSIGREFHTSLRDGALLYTVYLLAYVVSIAPTVKLADSYGRRPVYLGSLTLFAIGSAIAALAPSFELLLIGRAIQALGGGGIFPVATATIADRIPLERRGGALGIIGAVWGVAAILGPIIGGLFTGMLSWRWIFLPNVPLAVIVMLLAYRVMPMREQSAPQRGKLDIAGLATITVGLTALMLALLHLQSPALAGEIGGTAGWSLQMTLSAFFVALLAALLLHRIEYRAGDPILPPNLLTQPQLALTYALEVVIGVVEAVFFFIPATLMHLQGLSPFWSGAIGALAALVFFFVVPISGRAIDRVGVRAVLGWGAGLASIGLALFAWGLSSLPLTLAAMLTIGAGFGSLLGAPTRYIVSREAPAEQRTTALGILSLALIIGQLLGGSLVGGLLGPTPTLPQYRLAYLALTLCSLVVLWGSRRLQQRTAGTA